MAASAGRPAFAMDGAPDVEAFAVAVPVEAAGDDVLLDAAFVDPLVGEDGVVVADVADPAVDGDVDDADTGLGVVLWAAAPKVVSIEASTAPVKASFSDALGLRKTIA